MKMNNDNKTFMKRLLIAGGAIALAAATAAVVHKTYKKHALMAADSKKLSPKRNIYIDGSSLSALAAAAFLVSEGKCAPSSVHIYGLPANTLSGIDYGSALHSFKLLMTITDAEDEDGLFVADVMDNMAFESVPEPVDADKAGELLPMGLKPSRQLMKKILKYAAKMAKMSDDELNETSVMDFFADDVFFESDLYLYLETVSGIKPEYKLAELIKRLELMSAYNSSAMAALTCKLVPAQYILDYLDECEIDIKPDALISDAELDEDGKIFAIDVFDNETKMKLYLNKNDFVIIGAGDLCDGASCGSFSACAPVEENVIPPLWSALAEKSATFGNPCELYDKESPVMEFDITDDDGYLLNKLCEFADCKPENGLSLILSETPWKLCVTSLPYNGDAYAQSIEFDDDVITEVPEEEIPEQAPIRVRVTRSDIEGDFMDKSARECTGVELLFELCAQVGLADDWDEVLDRIKEVNISYYPYMNAAMRAHKGADVFPKPMPCPNCVMAGMFANLNGAPAGTVEQEIFSGRCASDLITGRKARKLSKAPKINFAKL